MGSHVAPAANEPPSLWDRATTHGVEATIVAYGVFEAIKVAALAATTGLTSIPLMLLPLPLLVVLILFVGGGGAIALKGLLMRCEDLRKEINTEQVGWALLGLGWLGYGIASDILDPRIAASSDLGYAVAIASAWRYYGLRRIEKALERVDQAVDNGGPPVIDPQEAGP